LFLASRACENSTVQDAIGARRVVEDVQEALYRANYLGLTTLPLRSAGFLSLPPPADYAGVYPVVYPRIQRFVR